MLPANCWVPSLLLLISCFNPLTRSLSIVGAGRNLLQDINSYSLSPALKYLIPTVQSTICAAGSGVCCQADDYASPFEIRQLNSSFAVIAGRSYTTFFMSLVHTGECDTHIDLAGCCGGSVSSVWLDAGEHLLLTRNASVVRLFKCKYSTSSNCTPLQSFRLSTSCNLLLAALYSSAVLA